MIELFFDIFSNSDHPEEEWQRIWLIEMLVVSTLFAGFEQYRAERANKAALLDRICDDVCMGFEQLLDKYEIKSATIRTFVEEEFDNISDSLELSFDEACRVFKPNKDKLIECIQASPAFREWLDAMGGEFKNLRQRE